MHVPISHHQTDMCTPSHWYTDSTFAYPNLSYTPVDRTVVQTAFRKAEKTSWELQDEAEDFMDVSKYIEEITHKCVQKESLRLQKKLLRKAVLALRAQSSKDVRAVQEAAERVHVLADRITMLSQ
jgi:hypothetical protein